ncbi:hypothetical protein C1645_734619 [Glomus cerebriforme]|uniref:Uncharacterized protein n=1 Tax=Glomus cerebriforme TaxID=658196 RepID=A0A397T9T7_9GLOM|nr:hypothetical protein C1645_734619 [Glomus cerebriforme]
MFKAIFNHYSRRLILKSSSFSKSQFRRNITSENKLLEFPQWKNKVDFTQKELILHDIDKRRKDIIEHRITQAENKLLFIVIGATLTIISTVLGSNMAHLRNNEIDKKISYALEKYKTGEKVDVRTSLEKNEANEKK